MKERTVFFSLPSPTELANLLLAASLPKTLSNVNKQIHATAVRSEIAVVTRDRGLARAIRQRKLNVGNVASVLQDLVETKKLRLTDELSKEASNANVKLVLRAEFDSYLDVGGDQFTMIRDVLESLSIGKIAIEAVPASPEASDG
jgi:hypothetical protein